MTYTVIFEQGPTSWGAYVPDLPGVVAAADSREEVEHLIEEAMQFHVEGLKEAGLEIPEPTSFAGQVKVGQAA
jgi:predicted RNase H-like HicB family nuclease